MSDEYRVTNTEPQDKKSVISRRDLAFLPVGGLAAAAIAGGISKEAQAASGGRPSVETRLDVMELLARHSWAYDCGDAETYAATYTEDGVFEAFGHEAAKGREALAKSISAHNATLAAPVVQQHNTLQYVFEGDDSAVSVYTYANFFEFDPATKKYSFGSFSYYKVDCVKVGGQWLIKKRALGRMDGKTLPWKA
jgi:hypothetical protein